jgi:mRNA interferase MazF
MSATPQPRRGEVWVAQLNPTRGHEQAGRRPVLIVSVNPFNASPAGLVYIAPFTRTVRGIPLHVPVAPPEGGLRAASAILCDAVRSISVERLDEGPWGSVSSATMSLVEDRLRRVFGL